MRAIAPFLGLSIAIAAAGAAGSKPVALALKRTDAVLARRPNVSPLLAAGAVALDLTDERGAADPQVIGAYREKGRDVYLWRSETPVGPSVRSFAEEILAGWSIQIAADADPVLALGLVRFEVEERPVTFGSTYEARVTLRASLNRRDGTAIWTREVDGRGKRSGVDGRAAMCNEALSIALHKALSAVAGSATPETAPLASSPPAPASPAASEPEAVYRELLRLKEGGVGTDVLVAYVAERTLTRPLTVDEILLWKNAGIPDEAIKAATARRTDR